MFQCNLRIIQVKFHGDKKTAEQFMTSQVKKKKTQCENAFLVIKTVGNHITFKCK